jgi:hypothetical protein
MSSRHRLTVADLRAAAQATGDRTKHMTRETREWLGARYPRYEFLDSDWQVAIKEQPQQMSMF